jgi:hypothetical protein
MGILLFFADSGAAKAQGLASTISVRHALLVGCAQALAIVPGVSRSGATISMALFLGYRREEAARFSFLLALPITLGAALHSVPKLLRGTSDFAPLAVGLLAAAISGFVAIRLLLAFVRTRTYLPFVAYRLAFALLVVAVYLFRASVPQAASTMQRSPASVGKAAAAGSTPDAVRAIHTPTISVATKSSMAVSSFAPVIAVELDRSSPADLTRFPARPHPNCGFFASRGQTRSAASLALAVAGGLG